MCNSKWNSLSGRLIVCLVFAILGMSIVIVHSFFTSWIQMKEDTYNSFQSIGEKMQETLIQNLDEYSEVTRVAGYSTTVQKYLLSDNAEVVIKNYNSAMENITSTIQSRKNCMNLFLYSSKGRHLYANSLYTEEFMSILKERKLDQNVAVDKPFFVSVPTLDSDSDSQYVFYFSPIYSISPFEPQNTILCAVLCNTTEMADFISHSSYGGSVREIAVLMYDDTIVSTSDELTSAESSLMGEIPVGQSKMPISSETYLTMRISLSEQHWDYIYIVSESQIFQKALSSIIHNLLPLCLIIILIIVFLSIIIISANLSIKQIVNELNNLNYDNFSDNHAFQEPKLAELKTIIQSVNHMLVRLDTSFKEEQKTRQQLYDAMAAQRKAELMAYRSQINPHFLFNTMECIRSLAHNGATEQVETMISSMAQIFRYSLYSTTMSTLGQEIHHVENYFNVMNIRYCGRFKIKIIADEQARSFPILSMILQPIVENSLKYAFEEKNENCLVTILAKVWEDGSLIVKCCDNGCGLNGEELTELTERIYSKNSQTDSSSGSIGLQNINRRLCLTFGENFHMKILSQVGHYTVVELHVPFFNGLPFPK